MTLDELTAENRVLQDQKIRLENHLKELNLWLQQNEAVIAAQLDKMNSDCEFCMGNCK